MKLDLHQDLPEFMLPEHIVLLQAYISRLEPGCEQPYLDFACHAAFPLVLTPDLLHHLWVNFPRDIHNEPLDIPWIASADLLLSSLCQPVGGETFEMDAGVREVLLQELLEDERFGKQRIQELADFIRFYIDASLESDNPSVSEAARVQELNALAHTRPDQTVERLAEALRASIQSQNALEQLRLAALIEGLRAALARHPGFAAILGYAQERRRALQGAPISLSATLTVSGVELPPVDINLPMVAQQAVAPPQQAAAAQTAGPMVSSVQVHFSIVRSRSSGYELYELTARMVTEKSNAPASQGVTENSASSSFRMPTWQQDWLNALNSGEWSLPSPQRHLSPEQYAADLYRATFTAAGFTLDWSTIGAAPVKVSIELVDAPELEDLPWNFLFDGERYLLERGNVSILRYEPPPISYDPSSGNDEPLRVPLPLRMLVACVAPVDMDSARARQEAQAVGDAFLPLAAEGLLEVETLVSPSYEEFTSSLRQSPPAVVYYFGWFEAGRGAGQSTLAFGDRDAQAYDQVSIRRFSEAVMAAGSPLFIFDGYERRSGPRLSDPAADLLEAGLPSVLMTYGVAMARDQQALLLQTMMRSLASGGVLESALLQARQALLSDSQNRLGWGLPVLYARTLDFRPFAIQPGSPAVEQAAEDFSGDSEGPPAGETLQIDFQFAGSEPDYRLVVRASWRQSPIETIFTNPILPTEWLDALHLLASGTGHTLLHTLGSRIFTALFQGDVNRLFLQAFQAVSRSEGQQLRLVFHQDAASTLAWVPWELLSDGQQFYLSRPYFSILRHVPPGEYPPRIPLPSLLRVLVGCDSQDKADEARKAYASAGMLTGQETDSVQRVVVDVVSDFTPATWSKYLLDSGKQYHILHLLWDAVETDGTLSFNPRTSSGEAQLFSARLLDSYFEFTLVHLLVLPQSRSSIQVPSLAHRLANGVLAAVVTTVDPLPLQSEITLTAAFFAALAEGLPLDLALQAARRQLPPVEGQPISAIPCLTTSLPDFQLFLPPAVEVDTGPAKPEPQPVTRAYDFDLYLEGGADKPIRIRARSPAGESSGMLIQPVSEREVENFYQGALRPSFARSKGGQEPSQVREFGARLFDSLMEGQIGALYAASYAAAASRGEGLRIRMHLGDPALDDLPWEYLFETPRERFLALTDETPVIRVIDLPASPARPLQVTSPLRMLAIIPSPRDLVRIDESAGRSILNRSLAKLVDAGQLVVDYLPSATFPALRSQLEQAEYHILSFTGHGRVEAETQKSSLAFGTSQSRADWIDTDRLGALLAEHPSLRLVVADASATGHRRSFNFAVANSLLRQGVPCLVTFQSEISNAPSYTFVETFYASLVANQMPVDRALTETRRAIFYGSETEWGVPVLYTRLSDLQLFEIVPSQAQTANVEPEPVQGAVEPEGPPQPPGNEHINPYVGPRPFTEQDARFYFGGENAIQEILKRLADEPLLIVTGPPGSGKTSLIQAGLLPALEKGALEGSQDWVVMTARPGDQPLENLALTVAPENASNSWLPQAVRRLRSDPAYLSKLAAERYQHQRTFWFIDNLEELFTLTQDTALQQDYLEVVLQLASQGLRVVLAMKVESLGHLLNLPAGKVLERSIFSLAPRRNEELRLVIERPAQQAGITLEEGLVDQVIKDVSRESNPLGAVQAVLHALYEASPEGHITMDAYNRLGGARGIIGKSNLGEAPPPA